MGAKERTQAMPNVVAGGLRNTLKAIRSDRSIFAGWVPAVAAGLVVVGAVSLLGWHSLTIRDAAVRIILAGVGSMILIETAKRLIPLRALYQRRQVEHWVIERTTLGKRGRSTDPTEAELALSEMSWALGGELPSGTETAGDPGHGADRYKGWRRTAASFGGVLSFPPDQLGAQLARAAQFALETQPAFPRWRAVLVGGPQGGAGETSPKSFGSGRGRDSLEQFDQDLARVAFSVDEIQMRITVRWAQYLQTTACWLSGAVALGAATLSSQRQDESAWTVLLALVFGGFFAWLLRDISAAIEALRR